MAGGFPFQVEVSDIGLHIISAHKSQSSSYLAVLVDMENILQCTDPEELRQLQYVALSQYNLSFGHPWWLPNYKTLSCLH